MIDYLEDLCQPLRPPLLSSVSNISQISVKYEINQLDGVLCLLDVLPQGQPN